MRKWRIFRGENEEYYQPWQFLIDNNKNCLRQPNSDTGFLHCFLSSPTLILLPSLFLNLLLGRSPGEGKGYPLQYSGLEKSMGWQRVGQDWVTFTFTFRMFSILWIFQHSFKFQIFSFSQLLLFQLSSYDIKNLSSFKANKV